MGQFEDMSTSPDTENKGVFMGFFKGVNIHQFVRDLLLFGANRAVEVCEAWNLSADDFDELVRLPAFKKEMKEMRALIDSSPNALIQIKARTIVERGLDELQHIIRTAPRDADRIKAMELLIKIAGITSTARGEETDSGRPAASGLVLNVNLGPGGMIPSLPDRPRPLRDVTQIFDVEAEKI